MLELTPAVPHILLFLLVLSIGKAIRSRPQWPPMDVAMYSKNILGGIDSYGDNAHDIPLSVV
jgi:hypothetical protein